MMSISVQFWLVSYHLNFLNRIQLNVFCHFQTYVFGRPGILTKPVIFATAFMSFFSVVIALFKVDLFFISEFYINLSVNSFTYQTPVKQGSSYTYYTSENICISGRNKVELLRMYEKIFTKKLFHVCRIYLISLGTRYTEFNHLQSDQAKKR